MELVVEKPYSTFLFQTSHLTLISTTHALYRGCYDISLLVGLALVTSLNYWRNPTYGLRRNMDIICVFIALFYHIHISRGAEMAYFAQPFLILGMLSYPTSWYYMKHENKWIPTYYHALVHLFFFLYCNILYSGRLECGLDFSPQLASI